MRGKKHGRRGKDNINRKKSPDSSKPIRPSHKKERKGQQPQKKKKRDGIYSHYQRRK